MTSGAGGGAGGGCSAGAGPRSLISDPEPCRRADPEPCPSSPWPSTPGVALRVSTAAATRFTDSSCSGEPTMTNRLCGSLAMFRKSAIRPGKRQSSIVNRQSSNRQSPHSPTPRLPLSPHSRSGSIPLNRPDGRGNVKTTEAPDSHHGAPGSLFVRFCVCAFVRFPLPRSASSFPPLPTAVHPPRLR